MSRATRLIRKLDEALAQHQTLGDAPESFFNELVEALKQDVETIQDKDKPKHWAEIYVELYRALIKQEVINRIMQGAQSELSGELLPVSRSGCSPPNVRAKFSDVNTSEVSP